MLFSRPKLGVQMDPKDISIESLGMWEMSSKDMGDLYDVYWPDSVTQKKHLLQSKITWFQVGKYFLYSILIGGYLEVQDT